MTSKPPSSRLVPLPPASKKEAPQDADGSDQEGGGVASDVGDDDL